MLIDDFTLDDGRTALGTEWRCFTDRVMGGVSSAAMTWETLDGRRCLRLRGQVSLANRGGFIQAATELAPDGFLDASACTGIRIVARALGDGYFLHLRTRDTGLPWQHYSAPLAVTAGWQTVDVPFAAFTPQGLATPLAPRGLERLGIVAAKREFTADIAVARVELYR